MTRRLFLHIGSHKTGTTSLQASLDANRDRLEAVGISYVIGLREPNLHSYFHRPDPARFIPHGLAPHSADALAEALAAAPGETVIGSSENLSYIFDPAVAAELATALRRHFAEIRILCYLRRQDTHLLSHHQEGAKPHRLAEALLWGQATTALPPYDPRQDLYLDYDRRIAIWAAAFGQEALILRVHDRARLRNGDTVADFLDAIGHGELDLASLAERNPSSGRSHAKLGHLLHDHLPREPLKRLILERLPDSPRQLPARSEAMALLDRYREGNRRLNARFGITDLPDLFDDDFSLYPEVADQDWTEETANAALRTTLDGLAQVTGRLLALTPEDLRDAATALEARNPEAALRLILAAQAQRPDGPLIRRKRAELEARLAMRNTGAAKPGQGPAER